MAGWTQEQIDNWQDPMMIGMQQGPKTGMAGISPLPNLFNEHFKPSTEPKNPNPVYQNFMDSEFNTGGPDDSVKDIMPQPIIDGGLAALPNYDDKFAGYDKQIGGFDNQFKDIIGRLDKLEQGIGTMANTDVPAPSPIQGGVPSVYTGPNARGY